jgi:hypothetical protein
MTARSGHSVARRSRRAVRTRADRRPMVQIVWFGADARDDFGRYAHGRVGQERMSFRTRLTSFFVLIVVVPMVAVGFLVFRLIDDSVQGKADARVAGLATAAASLYISESAEGTGRRRDRGAQSIAAQRAIVERVRGSSRALARDGHRRPARAGRRGKPRRDRPGRRHGQARPRPRAAHREGLGDRSLEIRARPREPA